MYHPLCAHVAVSGWGLARVIPFPWAAICAAAVTGPPRSLLAGVSYVPPWSAQESGLLVVADPVTGQLNTRFAWGPGQRIFCAVGDPWSKQLGRA